MLSIEKIFVNNTSIIPSESSNFITLTSFEYIPNLYFKLTNLYNHFLSHII